jgi:hypothetical protein
MEHLVHRQVVVTRLNAEESPIQTLTATATAPTGSSVVWFDAATEGNIVADPSLSQTGTNDILMPLQKMIKQELIA